MTPYETHIAMDAARWRDEQKQREDIGLSWRIAALSRAKKLPTLEAYLNSSKPPKKLKGREKKKRRDEFNEMTKNVNLAELNKPKNKVKTNGQ